jgi:membrane fusion protein (multidrug efflux system)
VSAAQARAQMMLKSMTDGLVRAPFSGMVDAKNVSIGEWVSPGRALFTLVDDDPLKIELGVPEAVIAAIQLEQRVELFAVSHPDTSYWAKVTRIGAEIGKNRALIVEATLDKGSGLLPGTFAEAHVVIGHKTRVVLPQNAAPQRKKDKTYHAFVVRKGELEEVLVQLGPVPEKGKVSIISGVKKGDKVVANVTDDIVDGLKVVE